MLYSVTASCREAVEHFLAALNMQRQSHGPKDPQVVMSKNIWSTLRMAVSLMGRPELYDVCDNQDLDRLNSEFGMNSWYNATCLIKNMQSCDHFIPYGGVRGNCEEDEMCRCSVDQNCETVIQQESFAQNYLDKTHSTFCENFSKDRNAQFKLNVRNWNAYQLVRDIPIRNIDTDIQPNHLLQNSGKSRVSHYALGFKNHSLNSYNVSHKVIVSPVTLCANIPPVSINPSFKPFPYFKSQNIFPVISYDSSMISQSSSLKYTPDGATCSSSVSQSNFPTHAAEVVTFASSVSQSTAPIHTTRSTLSSSKSLSTTHCQEVRSLSPCVSQSSTPTHTTEGSSSSSATSQSLPLLHTQDDLPIPGCLKLILFD